MKQQLVKTHRVVAGAGPSRGFAAVASGSAGLTGVVQVFVVEQLLRVHADGCTHVQTQFLLKELPLTSQTLLWVDLSCSKRRELELKPALNPGLWSDVRTLEDREPKC